MGRRARAHRPPARSSGFGTPGPAGRAQGGKPAVARQCPLWRPQPSDDPRDTPFGLVPLPRRLLLAPDRTVSAPISPAGSCPGLVSGNPAGQAPRTGRPRAGGPGRAASLLPSVRLRAARRKVSPCGGNPDCGRGAVGQGPRSRGHVGAGPGPWWRWAGANRPEPAVAKKPLPRPERPPGRLARASSTVAPARQGLRAPHPAGKTDCRPRCPPRRAAARGHQQRRADPAAGRPQDVPRFRPRPRRPDSPTAAPAFHRRTGPSRHPRRSKAAAGSVRPPRRGLEAEGAASA